MDQTGASRIREFITRYQSVFLVLLAGILLMMIPSPKKSNPPPAETVPDTTQNLPLLQEQLAEILSQMEGAGRVKVLLTTASGERTIYQTDSTASGSSTVIVTDSSRNQVGVVTQVEGPQYLGAIVVCQGADRPSIRLTLTQAVSNATGLSFDRISILKMK